MGTRIEQKGLNYMQTLEKTSLNCDQDIHKSTLLDLISQWPDWKIQALCLDESDLKIKEVIQDQRKLQNSQ